MKNIDLLKTAFSEITGLSYDSIDDSLEYGSLGWDSVAHMKLIALIENSFDIMIDTEDVIDMSSFSKAKTILKKYNIEF